MGYFFRIILLIFSLHAPEAVIAGLIFRERTTASRKQKPGCDGREGHQGVSQSEPMQSENLRGDGRDDNEASAPNAKAGQRSNAAPRPRMFRQAGHPSAEITEGVGVEAARHVDDVRAQCSSQGKSHNGVGQHFCGIRYPDRQTTPLAS